MNDRLREAGALLTGVAWGAIPMTVGVWAAQRLVDREEAELRIRMVAAEAELPRWLALAEETGTWTECYRACCLGLSVDEWEPAARAGLSVEIAAAVAR